MWREGTLLICFLFSFISFSYQLNVEILNPINSGPEAALIITPGAEIDGAAYKPLASLIQKASPLKLWVALLEGFVGGLPNPLEISKAVNMALSALEQKGIKDAQIFIAGHSLGGSVVASYASKNNKMFKGVLLYAAYLTRGSTLKDYPLPVLTLSGELDGLARITRIFETFEELVQDVAKDKTAMYRTPVIIMPGVNHAQFASGDMPSTVVAYDLQPDVTNTTAYAVIANYTSAFISSTVLQSSDAKMQLEAGFNTTHSLLLPLATVNSFDVNPQLSSGIAVQAQYTISGLNKTKLVVKDVEVGEQEFLRSTPKVDVQDNMLYVTNYATVTYSPNPLDTSTDPQAPLEIQAKLKSKEALKALFPSGNFSETNLTCKDVNTIAYAYALSSAAPKSVNRMNTRGISKVIFNDDVPVPREVLWNLEPLELDYEADGMHVTSYSYSVPVDPRNKENGGFYNCKLLSPYRALEWIYVDSLRNYNLTHLFLNKAKKDMHKFLRL